ncbi:Tripartite motif-containing protein 65 [Liparis tanakae]|uniref:Tripartite motif-containing protein 65 n=1 Tax=Liparis tanakae TaxID=230148 RepID=A0A4Z2IPP3_9TELE|nr:Tripartite motif-containing protein 65 [Liparis tanakae]
MARVTQHILSGMRLLSPCGDREGCVGELAGSNAEKEEEEEMMVGLSRRGDSGGGVSQPISDTGEPFLTYEAKGVPCSDADIHSISQVICGVHTVHGQDGVPDIKRLGLVRCESLEYLTDEDGHFILLPTFDADPESSDILLAHLNAPLSVGNRLRHSLREVRERIRLDFAPLKFSAGLDQPARPFRRKLLPAPPARDPICWVEFAPPAVSRSHLQILHMATAGSFLSEDQFLCSICLDVFTQPVSIPCGHNFCNACIHRHWENQEQCQCPLCNEKFKKGLKLRVNIGFREVVENFKKHHASADNNSLAKPDQVPCDCCLGKKFKATKTCLVRVREKGHHPHPALLKGTPDEEVHPKCRIYSPAMAKPPSALASAWGSHTHFLQHSPGTWTLRGVGQSGPGSITSTLQRGTQAICPSRHIHWYLQLGKKVWPF